MSGFLTAVTTDASSHEAAGYVFNGLVRYDKDLKLEGELAESWEVSPDGKRITFHLRKGVKWHDGAPFTSDDVMFTYRRMIDPRTPTAYGEDFKQVKRAAAPDPHTFVVEYARPFAPALASWGMHVLPKHLLENYPDISKSPLNKKPVGTGPYRFVEWKTGEKIVFDASPDYFEGKPYIARVITRVIPDQATMFLELKSGGVDIMTLTPPQYVRQTETAEFRKSFNKYKYTASGYTYLGFRLSHPFFTDKRVRQAIAHAADKKALIDGVLLGLGQEATGPYKPGTWAYNPNVRKYPHDPARAKALLAEAGWKEKDGVLVKDGQAVRVHGAHERGERGAREDGGDPAAEPGRGRDPDEDPDRGVGGLHQRVHRQAEVRRGHPRVEHHSRPGPVRHLALLQDGPQGAEPRRVREPRGGPPSRRGTQHVRPREAEKGVLPDPGDPGRGAAVRLPLSSPRRCPVVQNRFRGIVPAPAGITYNFIKWYVPAALQKHKVQP